LTIFMWRRHRSDVRQLALALAFPSFLVLLALESKYNVFLTRFLLVPAALTAPLFGGLFRSRVAGAALLVVGVLVVGLTLTHDRMKPLQSAYGRPWQLTQSQALELNWQPQAGDARAALE